MNIYGFFKKESKHKYTSTVNIRLIENCKATKLTELLLKQNIKKD